MSAKDWHDAVARPRVSDDLCPGWSRGTFSGGVSFWNAGIAGRGVERGPLTQAGIKLRFDEPDSKLKSASKFVYTSGLSALNVRQVLKYGPFALGSTLNLSGLDRDAPNYANLRFALRSDFKRADGGRYAAVNAQNVWHFVTSRGRFSSGAQVTFQDPIGSFTLEAGRLSDVDTSSMSLAPSSLSRGSNGRDASGWPISLPPTTSLALMLRPGPGPTSVGAKLNLTTLHEGIGFKSVEFGAKTALKRDGWPLASKAEIQFALQHRIQVNHLNPDQSDLKSTLSAVHVVTQAAKHRFASEAKFGAKLHLLRRGGDHSAKVELGFENTTATGFRHRLRADSDFGVGATITHLPSDQNSLRMTLGASTNLRTPGGTQIGCALVLGDP